MWTETATEPPYVVKVMSDAGEDAVIKGTRTSVWFVARYVKHGTPAASLVEFMPHLTLASVYSAVSYYHDNRDEIEPLVEYADRMEAYFAAKDPESASSITAADLEFDDSVRTDLGIV